MRGVACDRPDASCAFLIKINPGARLGEVRLLRVPQAWRTVPPPHGV